MTRLLGRNVEFGALRGWLSGIAAGRGGVAFVEGFAGIGKTRLLAEVCGVAATDTDFVVASGVADQLGGAAPLAALLDALRTSDPPLVTTADLAGLAELADQRIWLLDRIRAAIEKQAGRRPVLVVVDDLQWADRATLWAIGALAVQLVTVPVGWLLARRRAPNSPELAALLTKLDRLDPLHVRLGPLADNAADTLAGDLLGADPDPYVRQLVRRAGGNPFLVVEAVRAVGRARTRQGEAGGADGPTRRGSPSAEALWLAREPLPPDLVVSARTPLTGLDPAARRLLEVGAIFGRRFALPDVGAMLREPATALTPTVLDLVHAGVLVEEGDRLAFVHDLLWQAIYDDLPVTVRHAMHRDAARTLLAAGAPPLEMAHHLLEGARPGDTETAELLLLAARDAAPRAPNFAAELYTHALTIDPATTTQRPSVIVEAIPVLLRAGQWDQARELAGNTLRMSTDPGSWVNLHYSLSLGEALQNRYGEGAAVSHRGLTRCDLPDDTRALLQAQYALWLAMTGQTEAAVSAARAAAHSGRTFADNSVLALSLSAEAIALRLDGRLTEALDRIQDGVRNVGVSTLVSRHLLLLSPHRFHGSILQAVDRFDEADAAQIQARTEINTHGFGIYLHQWHVPQAELRLAAGRLDDAVAEAEAAVAIAEELQRMPHQHAAIACLIRVAIHRGNVAHARDLLSQAPPRSDGVWELSLDFARGLVAEADGNPTQALAEMTPIWSAFDHHYGLLAFTPHAAHDLVRIALRAGRRDKAGQAADAAARLARLNPQIPTVVAAAAHATGLLADDPQELIHAAQLFRESPFPLPRAAALEDAGIALANHGNQQAAITSLDDALTLFTETDAVGDARRVHQRLRSLGSRRRPRRTPPRPDTGWAALSDSELRVARGVAAGLTNRAVADQLKLSPHTVDSHLRHIFTKLDINTRVELARVAVQHETTTEGGS